MNLRLACLGVALLSLAASGDSPCSDGNSNSTGTTTTKVGQNGAVCGSVVVDYACCGNTGDSCNDNNDCCTGNCGASASDSGFQGDGGSACAEAVTNEGCTAALSSRCNTGQCACETDSDCCIGSCVTSLIPGTSGLRCCLETGLPCDINADCCSLMCDASGQCQ